MNKLGNGMEFYTFNNGDWGKVKEDKGSRDVGRWWKAATGGVRWRQWAAVGGRNRPKTEKTGEAEEAEQGTADGGAAGRRRVRQWRRRVPAVRLGGSKGPAPVTGGGEGRQRQKKQTTREGGVARVAAEAGKNEGKVWVYF